MAKVNLAEISKRTGYSIATVSNALNGKRNVSERAAERIRDVAREIGYQRSRSLTAIRLITARRTGSIIDESTFHPSVIAGVEAAARRRGADVLFSTLDLEDRDEARRQVSKTCSDPSCGIILLGTEMEEEDFSLFGGAFAPIVLLDAWSNSIDFDAVLISNESSAYHATSYLVHHGHRQIAYLAGRDRIPNFHERGRGVRLALRDAGLPHSEREVSRLEVSSTLAGAEADVAAWLARNPELPSAFFADNDIIAIGAMRAMASAGLSVPGDISVIGFDDIDLAAAVSPALTTIRVPRTEMGEAAVDRLFEKCRSPQSYILKSEICTTLVERESVADRA